MNRLALVIFLCFPLAGRAQKAHVEKPPYQAILAYPVPEANPRTWCVRHDAKLDKELEFLVYDLGNGVD